MIFRPRVGEGGDRGEGAGDTGCSRSRGMQPIINHAYRLQIILFMNIVHCVWQQPFGENFSCLCDLGSQKTTKFKRYILSAF